MFRLSGQFLPIGVLLAMAASLLCTACGGALGERHIEPMRGSIELPQGVRTVRFEGSTASLKVLSRDEKGQPVTERNLRYQGKLRFAADTPAQLEAVRGAATRLASAVDPVAADVLVVTTPAMPAGADPLHCVLGTELTVWLPEDLALALEAREGGYLEVEHRAAPVRMTTGRGDLRLSSCRGDAVLRTGAGVTIVDRHEGNLEVQAKSGEVQAWVRRPAETIRIVTGKGNIQCLVPAETELRADVRCEQGKIANGFGFPVERVLEFGAAMTGQRGNGRTEVVLRSGKGVLSLSHHVFD